MAFRPGDALSKETLQLVREGEGTTMQDTMTTERADRNRTLGQGCLLARHNATEHLPWDNPDNIASQAVVALVSQVRDLTVSVLFLIGGPTNVLNMIVFYKQGLRDRVNLCLFLLAAADILHLATVFWLHAENTYLHLSSQEVTTPMNEFVTNNNLTALLGFAFLSFTLSAVVSCERCYCVVRPLRYHTLMRTRTMAFLLLAVGVPMLALYYLVCYRYWIRCVLDPVTGQVSKLMTGGGLYATQSTLIDGLDLVLFGAGVPGGMMLVVIAATVITTVKLRHVTVWRGQTSSSLSAREVALTKMLIGNSVLFIVCLTPACVFRLVCLFLPDMRGGGRQHNFYITTLYVLEISTLVNSTFNFFVYYAMGSRYRETLWAVFGKKTHQGKGKN